VCYNKLLKYEVNKVGAKMPDDIKIKVNFEVSEYVYNRVLNEVAKRLARGEKANVSIVCRDGLDRGLSIMEMSVTEVPVTSRK
jgi:hypothetical protein